ATMICHVTGVPAPAIYWSKQFGQLSDPDRFTVTHEGTLTLTNPTIRDEGVYECKAENELGQAIAMTTLKNLGQEPSGISAHDGKRPDGCTLIPWRAGRCLAWDVTVPCTLAKRYVNLTSKECGLAAARAADEKMKKYGNALPSMEFLPICIEVLGPMDPNTLKFLKA
ncbi:hypothetical protein HELRODRAFT_184536, partial [Helobdella robusta]|uniref:Ig-like domain-containing protein n=1 Tax=Helobdella robusta TaxID=6412 RepID=T1FLF1_HELRO